MGARRVILPSLLPLIAALSLVGCGSKAASHVAVPTTPAHKPHAAPPPPKVDIYSGLPLSGPEASEGEAVLAGIKLALAEADSRAGQFAIDFRSLNDAPYKSSARNLEATAENARTVAIDSDAVYYIGDLSSAATAVSLPVISAAGIAQITPGNPYVAPATGAAATSVKLLRLTPDYTVEAAADLTFFKQAGCLRAAGVAQDSPADVAVVKSMYTQAKAYGIQMTEPSTTLSGKPGSVAAYAATLRAHPPCAVAIAGHSSKLMVQLAVAVRALVPRIIGTSGLCNPKWTDAADGGVPPSVDPDLYCTSPLLPIDAYPGGSGVAALYKRHYGVSLSSPYALYGYEAADVGIETINYLGESGNDRSEVRSALFDDSVYPILGDDGFDANGNTTLKDYGLYSVNPATGRPRFSKTLTP